MVSSNSVWAIVPAAGIGSRMLSEKPKQYLVLEDKTVLEHTLQRLADHPRIQGIIVAIAENDPWWAQISIDTDSPVYVVEGGKERADSVYNALIELTKFMGDDPWVLVHDAARPCIRHEDIDRMLDELISHPVGGILGIPVTDTVKRVDNEHIITETIDRQGLWRASTPQMFRLNTLKDALAIAKQQDQVVTDEASAIELVGLCAKIVAGHSDNIKITVPQDLALASLFMKQQGEQS